MCKSPKQGETGASGIWVIGSVLVNLGGGDAANFLAEKLGMF